MNVTLGENRVLGATNQNGGIAWSGFVTCEGLDGRIGGRRGLYGVEHCVGLVVPRLDRWEIIPHFPVTVSSASFYDSKPGEHATVTWLISFQHEFNFTG